MSIRSHLIQRLEARKLLAFSAEIVGDELRLTGTVDNESVRVALVEGQVEVTGDEDEAIASFEPDEFSSIVVSAGGGHDVVDITIDVPAQIRGEVGQDTLSGGGGDDSIDGGQGDDRILGNGGADTLDGSGGDDRLFDDDLAIGSFNDVLFGRTGNDTLASAGGSDALDGGSEGVFGDAATFAGRTVDLNLSLDGVANDGASGQTGNLIDVENVIGGSGDDTITGNGRLNILLGMAGSDTVLGLGGRDAINGGDDTTDSPVGGDDLLDGGSGNDTLIGAAGDDTLRGQGGDDQLVGYGGSDGLDGGSGDDSLSGLHGADTLVGSGGHDLLEASEPSPQTVSVSMAGGSGDDVISFNAANDVTALGNGGNDTFFVHFDTSSNGSGSSGGGGGNDSFQVNDTSETGATVTFDGLANDGPVGGGAAHNVASDFESVYGGNGDDVIDVSAAPRGMTIWGGPLSPEDEQAGGLEGDDTLIGSAFADLIEAGKGEDSLVGNGGIDTLRGSVDDDIIDALDGLADIVDGGGGSGDEADVDNGTDVVSNVETVI